MTDTVKKPGQLLLLITIFVIATCGLIYELVAGTLASYLLGDSVTQFSTIIGVYLFSMGIGSFLSRYFKQNLMFWFIQLEILVGVVGGYSSTLLFIVFEQVNEFQIILYGLVLVTGTLVGLEIPLLMRLLKNEFDFSELVSKVFTFDYIGALFASVLFPMFMIPYLGLLRTSFLFGLLNVVVALVLCFKYGKKSRSINVLKTQAVCSIIALLAGFIFSERIQSFTENLTLGENIIYSKSSPYQRILLTSKRGEVKLYLNHNLQFNSSDEYRYHEALVHPGLSRLNNPEKVLILGGGDGLALREVLKYPGIKRVKLVDLDPEVINLCKQAPILKELNKGAFKSNKVEIVNTDAFRWLKENKERYDFIIIDFPDPSNFSVGKLYTSSFYKELKNSLQEQGAFVVQSTSPFVARKSFWCVNNTIQSVGFNTKPYHLFVPSFGEWGYVLAAFQLDEKTTFVPANLKFYKKESLDEMASFPQDMSYVSTEVNKLNNQILVHYFESEWGKIE